MPTTMTTRKKQQRWQYLWPLGLRVLNASIDTATATATFTTWRWHSHHNHNYETTSTWYWPKWYNTLKSEDTAKIHLAKDASPGMVTGNFGMLDVCIDMFMYADFWIILGSNRFPPEDWRWLCPSLCSRSFDPDKLCLRTFGPRNFCLNSQLLWSSSLCIHVQ